MRTSTIIAAALAFVPSALAFSNGTLLPNYLCSLKDLAIGGPASLGAIIPHFEIEGSMEKIAEYHHYVGDKNFAAQDLCTAFTKDGMAIGKNAEFIVATKNQNEVLVGLIVWIQEFPHGPMGLPKKIGTFANFPKNMAAYPWHGCGIPGSTLVHTGALNDDLMVPNQSDPLMWMAPKEGINSTSVQVRGICITESMTEGQSGGYGKFAIDIPLTGAKPPAVTVTQATAAASATAGAGGMGNGNGGVAANKNGTILQNAAEKYNAGWMVAGAAGLMAVASLF
ncbi:hypothetical protein HDU76_004799 [Blyttiomyces sp. JEL0837]|nr:hypothetical protein HDU76_004799 [Blyttiomyces sp. JEL0837]